MLRPLLPGADVATKARVTMDVIMWSASARRFAIGLAAEIGRRAISESTICKGGQGCFRMRGDDLAGG